MRIICLALALMLTACQNQTTKSTQSISADAQDDLITPRYITDTLPHDSDDPAIWVNKKDLSQSLILGTDKEENGGIYAFNLKGKILASVTPVDRPNNIDVEYGLKAGEDSLDIAVFTERLQKRIRVLSLPDMAYIDGGGIPVFEGETGDEFDAPMGIALYKDVSTGQISAVVGRKNGPTDGTYLWQYILSFDGEKVQGELARKFADFSGEGEMEAIMVDDEWGYVFVADEAYGIRKYYAHPDSSSKEILSFGKDEFTEDREGIALCKWKDQPSIIVSDQQDHSFEVFSRDTIKTTHGYLGNLPLSTVETDGCEAYADSLSPDFPQGIFVAMSEGKVFHIYDLQDLHQHLMSK